jgi:hypothetical protein
VGFLPTAEIHFGDKDDRTAIYVWTAAMHIVVNLQLHRFLTVGTFRLDPNGQRLLPQSPLHEGRRKSVHRSGGVELLPGAEGNPVGGFFNGHRISPDDLAQFVPVQEGQVFFQIL